MKKTIFVLSIFVSFLHSVPTFKQSEAARRQIYSIRQQGKCLLCNKNLNFKARAHHLQIDHPHKCCICGERFNRAAEKAVHNCQN